MFDPGQTHRKNLHYSLNGAVKPPIVHGFCPRVIVAAASVIDDFFGGFVHIFIVIYVRHMHNIYLFIPYYLSIQKTDYSPVFLYCAILRSSVDNDTLSLLRIYSFVISLFCHLLYKERKSFRLIIFFARPL